MGLTTPSMQVISPLSPPSILNPLTLNNQADADGFPWQCPCLHLGGRKGPKCLVIKPFFRRGCGPCPCTITMAVTWGAQWITWVPHTFLPAPVV